MAETATSRITPLVTNLGKTAIHHTYSEAVILAKSTLEKYGVSHMGRLGGPGEPIHFFLGASRGIYLEGQRRAPPTAVQQRHLQTALPFWSATNPSSEMVIPTITFANSSAVSDYVDPLFQDYLRNGRRWVKPTLIYDLGASGGMLNPNDRVAHKHAICVILHFNVQVTCLAI
jgi:hypothetical protein